MTIDTNKFTFIKKLTFQEVFELWRLSEEGLEHWQNIWKTKGYDSWEDWRKTTHANLRGGELNWTLYEVVNPLKQIPQWRGGKFHSWTKWFYGSFNETPPRFGDIITHPGVHNHWYIRKIANNFPKTSTITAICTANDDIVVVEGMHRSCAIVLAKQDNIPVETKLTVVLASWPFGELPKLGLGWE